MSRRVRLSCTLFLLSALLAVSVRADAQAPGASTLSCADLLDRLRAKVEANYAGYMLEVAPHPERYQREFADAHARALGTPANRCFGVLHDFVSWFNDPHLFVFQATGIDSAESRRREALTRAIGTDERRARAYFSRNASRLDPIEGIWYDGAMRVAIVPDSAAAPGHFVAVILTPDSANWKVGQVRATFTRRAATTYDGVISTRSRASRFADAVVHKGLLLRLSPGMWGKEFPIAPGDRGLVDSIDPHRATIVVRNGTVIVSMPSHDPTYRAAFDSLLLAHDAELRAAPRMIVDLRGNEGGSSGTSDRLLPFIVSDGQRPPYFPDRSGIAPDHGKGMMLSSPDQLRYAYRLADTTDPSARRFIDRLRANPGKLVPFYDSLDPPSPVRHDRAVFGPRRVGVLIDHGTVSAAEVLVLRAWQSTRATIFGEPTAGALDYQSVSIVGLDPAEHRWGLGYPTITAHPDLPANGIRGKGIRPQVPIDLAHVRDPLAIVDAALRRGD